ncbi:secreted RxLR effector protein 78-like [Nicotiana sylvestris]|uniref:secreted RxLR effector protein 78-like n=1 Tax=Nicotiana sylvestris TaxID=4096 RepID=UPI00388C377C
MILKVDLEKAFDRLEWSFIKECLLFFNFPIKLTTLIMSCLTTTSISILDNGTHTEYFKSSRGIRQGDPMSPYLFIICMERLSKDIDSAVTDKDWCPISIIRGRPRISHLFFVDDLTMFSRDNKRNYDTILAILGNFHVASGYKSTSRNPKSSFSLIAK